jgi:hypothetical protein
MIQRIMRIYDLPDGYPSVRDWLDELSNEEFLAHIYAVQALGPAFAGCKLLSDDLWALSVPIGHGRLANLMFFSLKNGDYLAVHGFTSRRGKDIETEIDIARARKRDLI